MINEKVFPQLGILYVATALRQQGYEDIYVHDGSIEDIPKGYDIYALGATTPQFPQSVKALEHIKTFANGKIPKVIIGGPHATIDPESCIASGFDCVIRGEGETAIVEAIETDKKLIEGSTDLLIHPDRNLLDIKSYKYIIDGELATSVMTTRSCFFHCGFCCKINKRVKVYPAGYVIQEIETLIREYGYKALMFFDDIFIINKERLLKILDHIENYSLKWRCFARADIILRHGEDIAKRMFDAGCREIGMGVESGSDSILKVINKGETTETIAKAIKMLHEVGIRVKGFFIVGLPSESWVTIGETIKFIESVPLSDIDFTLFQPFKGSPIYDKKDTIFKDMIYWDENNLNETWYKGKPNEYISNVWTPELSKTDIVMIRNKLEEKYKKW